IRLAALKILGQGHADAVYHGLPDVADHDAFLDEMSLVLDSQPGAAAKNEGQVVSTVTAVSVGCRPSGHGMVEQRAVPFLDALELADKVGPILHVDLVDCCPHL